MKGFKLIFTEKGFTLIEIIVSLAILGIITVTFLTIFSGMFDNIANAGNESIALFGAQKNIENKMAKSDSGNTGFTIQFNGAGMTIKGQIIEEMISSEDVTESVKVFLPNY